MKTTTVTAAIVAFASLVFATPTPAVASKPVTRLFKLKTQLISGNAAYGGQYLTTYSIAKNMNVPSITSDENNGVSGYLNNTVAVFNVVSGGAGKLIMELGTPQDALAGWAPLTMNYAGNNVAGPPEPANATDFMIGSANYFSHVKGGAADFTGWRICDWVHGVPELLYETAQMASEDVPSSCASVYLSAKFI